MADKSVKISHIPSRPGFRRPSRGTYCTARARFEKQANQSIHREEARAKKKNDHRREHEKERVCRHEASGLLKMFFTASGLAVT